MGQMEVINQYDRNRSKYINNQNECKWIKLATDNRWTNWGKMQIYAVYQKYI